MIEEYRKHDADNESATRRVFHIRRCRNTNGRERMERMQEVVGNTTPFRSVWLLSVILLAVARS